MFDKYTVIGDPHSTPKSRTKILSLFEIIEQEGLPTIWLGDLLDTKEVVRSKCLNDYFDYLKSSKLHHIILVGNHDYHNLECEDHSLKVLGSLPNVTLVDKPTVIGDMTLISYIHDKAKIKELLKTIDTRVLVGHLDIIGFDYGNGFMSEDGLKATDFKKFDLVLSGHYHKYQKNKNITYLGTPFSHSFGEANQDKFIGTLNISKDSVNLELTPTDIFFQKHLSLDIPVDGSTNPTTRIYKFIQEHGSMHHYKFRLKGKPELIDAIDKSQFANYSIKWETEHINEAIVINISESLDNITQFKQWASESKNLDPETIKLGTSILEHLNAK